MVSAVSCGVYVQNTSPQHAHALILICSCCFHSPLAGVLEGISPASGDERSIMRETGRESLTFSGMGGAVFEGFPALEAVHFDAEDDGADDDDDKVNASPMGIIHCCFVTAGIFCT